MLAEKDKMSCSDSNDNTATAVATATVTPNSTEIEVVLDLESQRLISAQQNIPYACEESKRINQLLWNRSDSKWSIIRIVVLLLVLVVTLTTTIAAVCSGDLSKLSSAAASLNSVVQTLALNHNGTSSPEHSY